MCCTQKEMQAEGKKIPTDRWYQVKHKPCCTTDPSKQATEEAKREREGAGHHIDTKIECGTCHRNTLRFSRLVTHAEQHGGEELEIPTCELNCPTCDAKVSLAAWVLREMCATRGVLLNV